MLWIEPVATVAPVVEFIRQAHQAVDINAYLVTDHAVLRAIAHTVKRGLPVHILIERRPYGGRPHGELARLRNTGAEVRYAPQRFSKRFVFDHAKYMVSGNTVEIGSANLTWSAFHKNREYIWIGHNNQIAAAAAQVFAADWMARRAGAQVRQTLVMSPGATSSLVALIKQPGTVCIESEELGHDRRIFAALEAKGHAAHLLLPMRLSKTDRRNAVVIGRQGVLVRYLRNPYLHAKLIAGMHEAFVGSQNFTWSSLNRNREMGIILHNRDARNARDQCDRDWSRARD